MSLVQKAHDALTDAIMHENMTGGEARQVVLDCAVALGIDLGRNPLGGQTWGPENMARVTRAVRDLKRAARKQDWTLV